MLYTYTHIFIYVIYNINIDIWIEGYLELLGCGLPPILKASRSCNLKASLAGPWTDCWRCWVTRYPIKTEQKTRERPVDSEDEHGIWLKLEGTLVDDDDDDDDGKTWRERTCWKHVLYCVHIRCSVLVFLHLACRISPIEWPWWPKSCTWDVGIGAIHSVFREIPGLVVHLIS